MIKIQIGAVNLDGRALTNVYIDSLFESIAFAKKTLDFEYSVVMVDNGSEDRLGKEFTDKNSNINLISNEVNVGVAKAWNQIIKYGAFQDLHGLDNYTHYFICNNDLYWTKKAVYNLVKGLEKDNAEHGWVSLFLNDYRGDGIPEVTDTVPLESRCWQFRPDPNENLTERHLTAAIKGVYSPYGGIDKFSDMLVRKHGVKVKKAYPIAPAFGLTRECIREIGLFEEHGSPVGLHEDIDYYERIWRFSDIKIGAAYGAYLHHFSMMTRSKSKFGDDWVKGRDKHWEEKWGVHVSKMGTLPKDYVSKDSRFIFYNKKQD